MGRKIGVAILQKKRRRTKKEKGTEKKLVLFEGKKGKAVPGMKRFLFLHALKLFLGMFSMKLF